MIYIEDYIDGVEFVMEAVDNESEFYYTELIAITYCKDYLEVNNFLNDLVTYRRYKKEKRVNGWFYSNIPMYRRNTTKLPINLIDLERMYNSWSRGLIDMNDLQEKAHHNALKLHIEQLKNIS